MLKKTMKQEYEIVNRNGLKMHTTAHSKDDAKGTVIIHHGYVGNINSPTIQLIRTTFNNLNFNTVTPNTTHNYNNSDGDYRDMTLRGHCEDLIDCAIHTVDTPTFQGPLILVGHSAGGHSALVAANELKGKYAPVLTIASAPLISGQRYIEGWKDVIKAHNQNPDAFIEDWKNKKFIQCGSDSGPDILELHWSVMDNWLDHDLIKDKTKPPCQTHLIGGEIDPFIRKQDILDYAHTVNIPKVSFIDKGDHSYTGKEQELSQNIQRIMRCDFN